MKKKRWITTIVIIIVLLLAVILLIKPSPETDKEVAECIGKNSVLYVQLGCHACESQENLFGDNYQYLNVIDCWFERDKCDGIESTPTWIIKGNIYTGVQSISTLQDLTGCS